MNQLRRIYDKLTGRQRALGAAAALVVVAGLLYLNRWNATHDLVPLLSGLAPEDAAAATAKLKEAGADYQLAENGSAVLVHSDKAAELRLALAAAGLPKSGRIGFELFDRNNFGESDFAEQVNYNRAIEGELERSVSTLHEVASARVHVTPAKDSIYSESRQPAKASVLLKLKPGAQLSPANVSSIRYLAASAVPGLSVDQVAVLDTNAALLSRSKTRSSEDEAIDDEVLELRHGLERDLERKIAATLDPLLGEAHFRVNVSADIDATSGEQNEELFDPQKSIVLTSQKTQDAPQVDAAGGVPGTGSNLPQPISASAGAASAYSRSTENVTYQPSRTVRRTKLPRGSLRRLSISVLVDHEVRLASGKRMVEAPAPERLKSIRELVTAAAGVVVDRGDQLVIEAVPFESTLTAAAEPFPTKAVPIAPAPQTPLPAWLARLTAQPRAVLIGAIGAIALAILVGGYFAVRGRSRARARKLAAEQAAKEVAPPVDLQKQIEEQMAEREAEKARQEAEVLASLGLPQVNTKKTHVLVKHIAVQARKNPAALAQVVRGWINEQEMRL